MEKNNDNEILAVSFVSVLFKQISQEKKKSCCSFIFKYKVSSFDMFHYEQIFKYGVLLILSI